MAHGRFKNTFLNGVNQRIVVALNETIKIMKEIDMVIEEQGGCR